MGAILLPLAFVDLRAKVRLVISTSDASHVKGGAAEARAFRSCMDPVIERLAEGGSARANEEAAFVDDEAGVRHLRTILGQDGRFCALPLMVARLACAASPALAPTFQACELRDVPLPSVVVLMEGQRRALSWAPAKQGLLVLHDPWGELPQKALGSDGGIESMIDIGAARAPEWEIWWSLRSWFSYLQRVELGQAGRMEYLGCARALARDLNRVLDGLVARLEAALHNGRLWACILPQRGKFWGHTGLKRMARLQNIYRTQVVGSSRLGTSHLVFIVLHNCDALDTALLTASEDSEPGALEVSPGSFLSLAQQEAWGHHSGCHYCQHESPNAAACFILVEFMGVRAAGSEHRALATESCAA